MATKQKPEHKMQPKKSMIPENRRKAQDEWEEENDNRMKMSGPAMRRRPQSAPQALTPAQKKTQERVRQRQHELVRKMVASHVARQNWINKPRMMRRIHNTFAKDPVLRSAVFRLIKGGQVAFTSLPAKDQLRIVKAVDRVLRQKARETARFIRGLQPDPNDPTNLYNQANPNNLVSQWIATQQNIIVEQDNQAEEEMMAENTTAAIVLTAAEEEEINEHNASEFNPSPTPEGKKSDDEENNNNSTTVVKEAATKEVEHHEERKILEHRGEEKALEGFMKGDKGAYMEGAKGASMEAGKEVLEHAAMSAAKVMLSAA